MEDTMAPARAKARQISHDVRKAGRWSSRSPRPTDLWSAWENAESRLGIRAFAVIQDDCCHKTGPTEDLRRSSSIRQAETQALTKM